MPHSLDWEEKLRSDAVDKNIAEKVILGIKRLLKEDTLLLRRNTHEQTVTASFACHLKPLFACWNVDCEFNRDVQSKDDIKRGKNDGAVKPDIIVHHRTGESLLVIECKQSESEINSVDTFSPRLLYFPPSPALPWNQTATGCRIAMLFLPKVLFLKRWHRGKPDRG